MTDLNIPLKEGQEIPSLTKIARMPEDREIINPVHEESYAKKIGLRGALIGGPVLLASVSEMLYKFFGQKWLTQGKIKINYIGGGALDGDRLLARGQISKVTTENGDRRIELEVWVEKENQEKIVVGQASCIK